MVGLFFFIRAATKDRTETWETVVDQPSEQLQVLLQAYFEGRAYRITHVDADTHQVQFSGFVRASKFLAVFLSGLAAIGMACFALVLAVLFPRYGNGFAGLLLLAPAAGVFYWKRAAREEQVTFTVVPEADSLKSKLTVVAHRDELIALQQSALVRSPGKPIG